MFVNEQKVNQAMSHEPTEYYFKETKGNILDTDNLNSLEIHAQCGDVHDSVYMASLTNDKITDMGNMVIATVKDRMVVGKKWVVIIIRHEAGKAHHT